MKRNKCSQVAQNQAAKNSPAVLLTLLEGEVMNEKVEVEVEVRRE